METERQKFPSADTLEKSTENVSLGFLIKAPFSYNQLNCNACPFLIYAVKSVAA